MGLQPLSTQFDDREALADYVAELTPWLSRPARFSPFMGSREQALAQLEAVDALHYGKTRNHLEGKVTRLSPYIRHGMLTLNQVRNTALKQASDPEQVEKLVQELAWRDYWQRLYHARPEWIWEDAEAIKTGFDATDYQDNLPVDIIEATTDVACINQCIKRLYDTGYLHNHARMYVASYVVHWRRVKWQAGAKWMHHHLIDGDLASNSLSWQWIASTFGNKPYIFNLDNVKKYADAALDIDPERNRPIDDSYEALAARLFPYRGQQA